MHRVFESLKHALARLFPAHGYLTERDEAYLAGAEDIYECERRQNDLDRRASASVTFPDQLSPVRFH
jgi:hypothetical protein